MKHIVFCFDGTWNDINDDKQTNVLLLSAAIARTTNDGTPQLVHYDTGVGTSVRDKVSGGILGYGLFENIQQAYNFLVFNYEPHDKVYAFGFSRGAFTARSFVGLVKAIGIVERPFVGKVKEGIELYKSIKSNTPQKLLEFRTAYSRHITVNPDDDTYRQTHIDGYVPGKSAPFAFRYIGLWDTVETLGVAKVVWPFIPHFGKKDRTGKKYQFHDHKASSIIAAGRHAVALDEKRRNFEVEPWGDLEPLNQEAGFDIRDPERPYQENFFPGVHGAVGGGGTIRGLSDAALEWVVQGAMKAGLALETGDHYAPSPDFTVTLNNVRPKDRKKLMSKIMRLGPRNRRHKPASIDTLHISTRRRLAYTGELHDGKYAPKILDHLANEIAKLPPVTERPTPIARAKLERAAPTVNAQYHRIVKGETIEDLAEKYLNDPQKYPRIWEMNPGLNPDRDDLYVGQMLRVPVE